MDWSEYFTYDDATGSISWAERPRSHFKRDQDHAGWNTSHANKPICLDGDGVNYTKLRISINGSTKKVSLHRIVWEIVNGPIPSGMQIDHIDGVRSNNNILNLRIASNSQNNMNKRAFRNSKTGIKGVRFRSGKKFSGKPWYSDIRVNGKLIHIGCFDTMDDAVSARKLAEELYHGEFMYKV